MDKSSGRNPATNSGSDSAKHHKGTAHDQYRDTGKAERSTPVQGPGGRSVVGNGRPPKADERSAVK